ncbi:MAG: hypothetical protein NPINA01_00190 [Nitrospinaceae bacterium]|nr:MAG: hypothetical protein NPINA01_00190 [Nitrospinaceae bacterium]
MENHTKKWIPLRLLPIVFLMFPLLLPIAAQADPTEKCENLTPFFQHLGQLVLDHAGHPPQKKLCRNVFKSEKEVNKGKWSKAIKKLNKFIKTTGKHTPENITQASADLLTAEARNLILIMENNMGLPPDPGEAGKATLEGIDSDNDGVRDDLQRYIALTYTDSAKVRALLNQHVKILQQSLIDADDKNLSIQHSLEKNRAYKCRDFLEWVLNIRLRDPSLGLVAETMNTIERSRAYIKYNGQLAGRLVDFGIERKDQSHLKVNCDFDPDSLPN